MDRTLKDFPEAFSPLVVVAGDRREARPKTRGDVLAYSVSTVDFQYLSHLGLPRDTLVLSDKIFVVEKQDLLHEKFAQKNILTIGSPAVNLLSRMINDQSLFRFQIDERAKEALARQEKIVQGMKRDRLGLSIYKAILEGARDPDDVVRVFRGKILKDDQLIKRFDLVYRHVQESGLENYRELLRNFEGQGILDPISGGRIDLDHPKLRGAFLQEINDFGFVSIAKHPFAKSDDFVAIYAAGRHGPATSHSVRLLSKKELWEEYPFGAVFEIQMDVAESYSSKLQEVTVFWETDHYSARSAPDFNTDELVNPSRLQERKIFLSAPLRRNDKQSEEKTRSLAEIITKHYEQMGKKAICEHPYDLAFIDWNYVNGIIKHFPQAHLIVHDTTGYPPGVMFEVGCSIGLNKRFILLWDTSDKAFVPEQMPALLRRVNIVQAAFASKEETEKTLKRALALVEDPRVEQCPGFSKRDDSSPCPYRSDQSRTVSEAKSVFIMVNPKWREVIAKVVQRVRENGLTARLPEDFKEDVPLCRICAGIASCPLVVIDVTDSDLDGLLTLGMARSRERRILELWREGSHGSSMFDGMSKQWREATLENDLDGALRQLMA